MFAHVFAASMGKDRGDARVCVSIPSTILRCHPIYRVQYRILEYKALC